MRIIEVMMVGMIVREKKMSSREREYVLRTYEPRCEKTSLRGGGGGGGGGGGVSDQVRHKPGCAATEDGHRLEISD